LYVNCFIFWSVRNNDPTFTQPQGSADPWGQCVFAALFTFTPEHPQTLHSKNGHENDKRHCHKASRNQHQDEILHISSVKCGACPCSNSTKNRPTGQHSESGQIKPCLFFFKRPEGQFWAFFRQVLQGSLHCLSLKVAPKAQNTASGLR